MSATAAMVLGAASFGLDLLGAYGGAQAAKANQTIANAQAKVELQQMRIQAKFAEEDRLLRLRETLGAQRAQFGAMGVVGGRTARLFEQQAQIASMREQDAMDFSNLTKEQAVRFGQSTARSAARVKQAQAYNAVLASGVSNAPTIFNLDV